MRMSAQDWALLFLLSLLWGGAFFFVAIAVRETPPLTIVALRTGLAALALAGFRPWRRGRGAADRRAIGAFFVMGLLNNLIPFSLLFWAQTTIPSGLASILNATTPIFSILAAHVLLADERLAANRAAGAACGFLGVVVLLGADLRGGAGVGTLGMLACLGAALSYGLAGVFGRRFKAMRLAPLQVAFGQLTATTVMMIPIAMLASPPWTSPAPGPAALAAIVALALLSTALAYVIFFRILESAGAVNVTLVTLLIPVSAILLGALFLGERLEALDYAGLLLIGLGLLVIDGRPLGWLRRRGRGRG